MHTFYNNTTDIKHCVIFGALVLQKALRFWRDDAWWKRGGIFKIEYTTVA